MVEGINHAIASGAHVLSMSMGGVGSNALVDAVNAAYDKGLVDAGLAGLVLGKFESPVRVRLPKVTTRPQPIVVVFAGIEIDVAG